MPEIVTDILIDASADRVWRVLADLPAYPSWNPLFRRLEGELTLHRTLTVTRTRSAGGDATDHPTIVLLRPGREIRWRSRLLLPFVLDVERGFKIEPLGPEQVRFVHWQASSGLLAYLLPSGSDSMARDHLEVMNLALRAQVEHGPISIASPKPAFASGVDSAVETTVGHGRPAAASSS